MPIEFFCQTCHVKMRTPDDAAGKLVRCPKCGQLGRVPTARPIGGSEESIQDFVPAEGDAAKPQPPFGISGSQPATEVSQSLNSSNPFSTPVADRHPSYAPYRQARSVSQQNLFIPGVFLFISGAIPLALSLFFTIAFMVEMIDRGPGIEDVIRLIITSLAGLLALLTSLGGIAMIRRRGYRVALAGSISALLLGAFCCFFPTAFGVWALVVLLSNNCPSVFDR
jgi:hypothetical protein